VKCQPKSIQRRNPAIRDRCARRCPVSNITMFLHSSIRRCEMELIAISLINREINGARLDDHQRFGRTSVQLASPHGRAVTKPNPIRRTKCSPAITATKQTHPRSRRPQKLSLCQVEHRKRPQNQKAYPVELSSKHTRPIQLR
jgi:hypothetical protein